MEEHDHIYDLDHNGRVDPVERELAWDEIRREDRQIARSGGHRHRVRREEPSLTEEQKIAVYAVSAVLVLILFIIAGLL